MADRFLTPDTLKIVVLGLLAFCFSTAGGLILGKIMYKVTGGKINPLIGSAGVSRRSHGGPRVPGGRPEGQPRQLPADACHGPQRGRASIGSAIAAGFLLAVFS